LEGEEPVVWFLKRRGVVRRGKVGKGERGVVGSGGSGVVERAGKLMSVSV
jgi:hypothetical protein